MIAWVRGGVGSPDQGSNVYVLCAEAKEQRIGNRGDREIVYVAKGLLGCTPRGSYSAKGACFCLLSAFYNTPLLRTLLRTPVRTEILTRCLLRTLLRSTYC